MTHCYLKQKAGIFRRCSFNRLGQSALLGVLLALALHGQLDAQDRTVMFSTSDPGVSRAITHWGVDAQEMDSNIIQRSLLFMGTNNVTLVRVGFYVDAPLTNNDVTPQDKTNMQACANLANMATAATKWDMNWGSAVNAWYQSGANTVYPDRWAAAMSACQRYYNRSLWMVEPFNEPDYSPWGEGSQQNLYDIMGYLQSSNNFAGTAMAGGSTLNDDNASSWYNYVASRASIGTTHCLAGSVNSYVSFIQNVLANGGMPFNPELHNVCEAIIGANYGLQGGIWWGTAERARGDFVKACQGKQLGYADDWPNWTAAAVYRGTNGSVQAFLGGSERMAVTTSYRFFCKDRDVFYDGYGPRRDCMVTVPGGTGYQQNQPSMEKVVNIAWGSDVQPPISGRYIIVNRKSHLVLDVPGGSTSSGTPLDQATYNLQPYQLWDVYPLATTNGGDCSYYTILCAKDGLAANVNGYAYTNGASIIQYGTGADVNSQWYFEYVGNGYFKIHSRWSDKIIGVSGGATGSGAAIIQTNDTGSFDQQWRLIPSSTLFFDFNPPAAPTGLTASPNAVSVRLNWSKNSESDLAGYTVLRSTTIGGPYDIVARGLTNNAFTDNSANQKETYYYVVQAVDKSLNTSSNSLLAFAAPTLTPTLMARYAFDGNANDSSGNGNDAELVGSPGYVSGQYGQALSLNGLGQYAMAPAGIMVGTTNFTIAAWVYWNGGAAWQRIFDFGNDTTSYMYLTPGDTNGLLRFTISTNGASGEMYIATSPLPTGTWVHVAVTYDGTTYSLYTNGVLVASGNIPISPTSFNPVLNYFGASQYSIPFFSGRLDDVRIYNYALNATQIGQLLLPPPTSSIWDGGAGNDNWSSGMNWNNDLAPATSGNDVIFAGGTRLMPNLDSSYRVNSLTFSNNASSFAIGAANGSTLTLAGGLTNNSPNAQTLSVPVILNGAQTLNAALGNITLGTTVNNNGNLLTVTGAGNTTINGAIPGTGGLTKSGSGTLTLFGSATYSGNTTVNAGTLLVNGANSGAGAITVNGGALGGTGSISASTTLNAGGYLIPGVSGVGVLNCNGNLTLNALSTNRFVVTTAGGASNQVTVAGTLTPNGSVIQVDTIGAQLGAGTNKLFTYGTINGAFDGTPVFVTAQTGIATKAYVQDDAAGNIYLVVTNAATGPSGPAQLTNSYTAGVLNLSWPAGQGWRLQTRTNLVLGNWQYITDGNVNSTNISIDPTQPTVFYRLKYP